MPAFRLAVSSAIMLISAAALAAPGGSLAAWGQHRDALAEDASVVRYCDFEEGGDELSVSGGEPENVDGRWPGKAAVRLDKAYLHSPPFPVEDKSFTVEAWLKTGGPGALRGSSLPTGATLLSVGIGYWDGWRVTKLWPDQVMGFEVGRPRPLNALGIRTGPVADTVWQHVAATWDGDYTRVYVDGLLMAEGEYAGDYTPPAAGMQFRIGYAGHGWGSAKLDVDEVVAYDRALSEVEILQHAFFYAPPSAAAAEALIAANGALQEGEPSDALAALDGMPETSPEVAALARLQSAQAKLAGGNISEALGELTVLLDDEALTDALRARALVPLRRLATDTGDAPPSLYEMLLAQEQTMPPRDVARLRLNLARSYAKAGQADDAQAQFEEVMQMETLDARGKADALLQAGHAAVQSGDMSVARERYAAVARLEGVPAQFASHAQLCAARTHVAEEDWSGARAAYEAVDSISGAPSHHALEAEECLAEVARLRVGKPARDPAASRTTLPKRPKPGLQLFVGPDGKATNRGTRNAPFATLTQARDAIRALDELPDGGVAVNVLPGAYEATSTFALEADDSGTEAQPITYRAHRKGTVRFSGGVAVTGFAPVTDAGILARMPEEAHGHVMQADLRAQGITEYGELMPRGTGRPAAPVLEVFFDDVPMKPARWPNDGFVKTGAIIDKGSKDPERDAIFTYDGERPSRWLQAKDAWLFGFWRHLWADDTLAVRGIDPDTHQIRAAPTSYGEVIGGMPYAAFNLLEEIDEPGEWYLDRMAGVLYLYPPSDPNAADVQVSMLDEPFVQTTDASWIAIEGLTFELGRGNGVEIAGGENCLVAGCTIRQIGGTGITVDGGTNHGALSCDIHTLGRYGTWVKGGDRQTLTPGGHFIENCHIYDFSRVCRTYTPAFWTDGVGNRFAHNRVHGSPGHGMRIEGNDHIIEYNEIFDVVRETDDQGGLDMWGNPTYRGVVLRYNYWHDIGNDRECGQCGIRLDDAICEVLIYGNVFYRCSTKLFGGVQIHGGKENYVENNLFADCRYAVSFSGWGPDRWHSVLNNPGVVKKGRDSVDITSPPHSTRYPALALLEEGEGINRVWRNLVYNCGGFLTRDRGIQDLMDNVVTMQDPGFVDAENLNFELKPDAPLARASGFRPIPFSEIGLYDDALRPEGE